MSQISFSFTTQYSGKYYALVHDHKNMFVNKSSGVVSIVSSNISEFVFSLDKKELNTYTTIVTSDLLESGIYTFRIYKQNGLVADAANDDLVSVGQTGWNKDLKIQQNANDILSSIQAYENRQDNIYRIDIILDSLQLGLKNGETGFARIDFDENTSNLKVKAFWNLNASIKPSRISIRGPASLGQKTSSFASIPIPSGVDNLTQIVKISSSAAKLVLSKAFYITIDTSSLTSGRIGGYPIYTPSSPVIAGGSVSFSVQPTNPTTGVSFRTR